MVSSGGPRAGLREQRCRHRQLGVPQRSPPTSFPCPTLRFGHSSRNKQVGGERSSLCFGPSGAARSARGSRSLSGRDRRGHQRKSQAMNDDFASLPFDAFSPDQEAASPSSHLLDELALHGYRPLEDDPDPRSLPTSDAASFALETAVEAIAASLSTRASRPISPIYFGLSSISSTARRSVSAETLTTMKPRSVVPTPNRTARKSTLSNWSH